MFGPVTHEVNKTLPDINLREYAVLLPLVAVAFWIGIYPKPLFAYIEKPVQRIVQQVNPTFYQNAKSSLQGNEVEEVKEVKELKDETTSAGDSARPR